MATRAATARHDTILRDHGAAASSVASEFASKSVAAKAALLMDLIRTLLGGRTAAECEAAAKAQEEGLRAIGAKLDVAGKNLYEWGAGEVLDEAELSAVGNPFGIPGGEPDRVSCGGRPGGYPVCVYPACCAKCVSLPWPPLL